MRRAFAAGLGALMAAVLAGAAGSASGAGSGGPPVTARSFSADAEGFPIEPGFGAQQFGVPFRPAATRSSLANAPVSAYARSALVDLGPAELYTAPNFPQPGSFAECDTARPNVPLSATAAPAAMRLDVTCDRSPASHANADGSGVGQPGVKARSVSSHTAADSAGDALSATAESALSDADVGPVHVGSARFHGEVRADGRPGGAAAVGSVSVTDSTVNGVPVVFGPDGVQVDQTRVPLDLVPAAADAVHTSLSHDGYSDVRLVQPQTASAADGTRATVSGGGLRFFGSSNDPQNNYFLTLTLVGGTTSVALGAPLAAPAGEPGGAAIPEPSPSSALPSGVPVSGSIFSPSTGSPAAAPATPVPEPKLVATRGRYDLPGGGSAWVWILVGTAIGAVVAAIFRQPLSRSWRELADRYVRG